MRRKLADEIFSQQSLITYSVLILKDKFDQYLSFSEFTGKTACKLRLKIYVPRTRERSFSLRKKIKEMDKSLSSDDLEQTPIG